MSEIFSYDKLPYPSKFFVQTFPDRLAVNATLFGMQPADPATCSMLELGCGNGSNLIAQAYIMPDARFVGIDLGKGHIDDAIAAAAELGLTNVEFRQMDVMEMSRADFGTFDYITAHGLFSWVPDFVRVRVLELYSELLNEQGVGYISYSAYPGAHQREITQRAMRFASRGIDDPVAKVNRAMSFLQFAAASTTDRGMYRAVFDSELKRHSTHDAADIFHDDLSDLNTPFYFHNFAERLAANGLQFLAEAELHAMGTNDLPPQAREFINSLSDIVEREQYLDILRGRAFRQTLFVHEGLELSREYPPTVLDKFKLVSSLSPVSTDPDLTSLKPERFVSAKVQGIEIDRPLAKTALSKLSSQWCKAVPFTDLISESISELKNAGADIEDVDAETDIVRQMFLQIIFSSDMIEPHLFQPDYKAEITDKPRVSNLIRWQMKNATNVLTGLGVDMKIEDSISRRMLELLDGKRTKGAVLDEIGKYIRSSHEIEGKKELLKTLPEWFDESLKKLHQIGAFE